MGSQNTTIYTIYTWVTNFINRILYIYVFDTLLYKLSYVKENIKIYFSSYYTLMIKTQRLYLHPRAPMLCI